DALAEIERIAAAEPFVTCAQVHGTRVLAAEAAPRWPMREKADGLLVMPGGPTIGLRFGDCAPVIVLSLGKTPWLLLLHSGFRGTLTNIVASGMAAAREKFGSVDRQSLSAWVGPCISGSCYTRRMDDPSTVKALETFSPDAVRAGEEYAHIDLKRQIARQLADCGVPEDQIWLETQCTCCRTDLFYSHRRSTPDDDPRMLLTVWSKNQ
ncbi:MAG: polyphenol oxidase family protein, partial [Pyramidobacter sp.]|nr:polyphenol oxidase family protein [Pyramidobacter sp.]